MQPQVVGVQERAEEDEELHAGEHVAEAHAPADAERHEVLGLVDLALGVEEAAGPEGGRVVPELLVHVHRVKQRYHLGTLGYEEALHVYVSVSTRKRDGLVSGCGECALGNRPRGKIEISDRMNLSQPFNGILIPTYSMWCNREPGFILSQCFR